MCLREKTLSESRTTGRWNDPTQKHELVEHPSWEVCKGKMEMKKASVAFIEHVLGGAQGCDTR